MDGFFNYDRDMMDPPEEREELDPELYVYIGCGQYRYVGDEIQNRKGAHMISREMNSTEVEVLNLIINRASFEEPITALDI